MVSYVERRLTGDYPASDAIADELPALARSIAERAEGNFLAAQLASRTMLSVLQAGASAEVLKSWSARLPSTVAEAIDEYLKVRFGVHAQRVQDLLLPLAYAQGSGLSQGPLWLAVANQLTSNNYTERDLLRGRQRWTGLPPVPPGSQRGVSGMVSPAPPRSPCGTPCYDALFGLVPVDDGRRPGPVRAISHQRTARPPAAAGPGKARPRPEPSPRTADRYSV